MQYIIILKLHYIIQIYSGITCGRVLNGEKSENSMKHLISFDIPACLSYLELIVFYSVYICSFTSHLYHSIIDYCIIVAT